MVKNKGVSTTEINGKSKTVSSTSVSSSTSISVFGVVVCILLFIALVKTLTGSEPLSFMSFLDLLKNSPVLDASSLLELLPYQISGNWAVFDVFRQMLNFSIDIINVLAYLFGCVINLLSFFIYFVRSLFI